MRLYLDNNLVKFDTVAESKGFKLTHFVDGLSEEIFDRIRDWQNLLPGRLQADGRSLGKEAEKLTEDVHVETEVEWDGYHCFVGINNKHAVLYFIPIESRETHYKATCWHEYNSSYSVDVMRVHLAFSTEDVNRYAVYVNILTRQFENVPLFLCCNVLTSFKALQVLAYTTALLVGNYRELESDCLEFTKAAAKLASQLFVTERELAKARVNLRVQVAMDLDDLTITNLRSEALSRRNFASRFPALVSIVLAQTPLGNILLIFVISLLAAFLAIAIYHFYIR